MRTYLMAGNWKMNKTIPETVVLTQQLCNQYNRKWDNVDIVLCPPAIDIKAAYTVLDFDKTNISLGAQNAHWEESGAFTGEISIPMIKDAGCEYCIVGHSERREMFNETDSTVNLKVKALVSAWHRSNCVRGRISRNARLWRLRGVHHRSGSCWPCWARRYRHEERCSCLRAYLGYRNWSYCHSRAG